MYIIKLTSYVNEKKMERETRALTSKCFSRGKKNLEKNQTVPIQTTHCSLQSKIS